MSKEIGLRGLGGPQLLLLLPQLRILRLERGALPCRERRDLRELRGELLTLGRRARRHLPRPKAGGMSVLWRLRIQTVS